MRLTESVRMTQEVIDSKDAHRNEPVVEKMGFKSLVFWFL